MEPAPERESSKRAVAKQTDTYYDPARFSGVATHATMLSWAFLILAVLILVADLAYFIRQAQTGNLLNILPTMLSSLLTVMVGLFFFVFLRAIAEGIYVLMDIEDNSRRGEEVLEEQHSVTHGC